MRIERVITTIDSHTAGEPTRLITGGLPPIPGNTMAEKMEYFRQNLDFIRTVLIHEPRGHRDMIGAVLLPSIRKEADFGVFYFEGGGYVNMCGHGTIGVCTTLAETGWVSKSDPETKVVLDTPAGLVTSLLRVRNGSVISGSLTNVPSFLYAGNIRIKAGEAKIDVDVAFGGNFYVLVNVVDLCLKISSQCIPDLVRYAVLIVQEVNKAVNIAHPEQKHIRGVKLVHYYGPPDNPEANSKNLIVGSGGNVDRSPCGTGTSARIGALYGKGKLGIGDTFCTESVIGTLFYARAVKETRVGDFVAVVPEITASAYITGFHQFCIDSSDPLKNGFLL